jgi:endonuclease YncB( thermonuclease family)
MKQALLGLAAACGLLCSAASLSAEEFRGTVTAVFDGDTVKVTRPGHGAEKVRLIGIDCPESAQPYGPEAKAYTEDLALGQIVLVRVVARDVYGRLLARVYVEELELGRELLKVGLAWRGEREEDPDLAAIEKRARRLKVGLWRDPRPVPPWEFRKRQEG